MTDSNGKRYLDFFAGAGTLNYGHNNPSVKNALLSYLENDGIMHGLDTATVAKIELIEAIDEILLKPRKLDYKIQFTGPTGTNAVEAAIKLARKSTQRSHIVAFTNALPWTFAGLASSHGKSEQSRHQLRLTQQ